MSPKKIRAFLDEAHVDYTVREHQPAYASSRVAAVSHVPGRELAKVVIVWIDGRLAMAVLPSTEHINLSHLRELTGARTVRLAREDEFADRFDNCELGAMPPFGNLYDMDVYVAEDLTHGKDSPLDPGTRAAIMTPAFFDFTQLVNLNVPPFGNLYGMDTYIAEALTRDATISFNACSHTEIMTLSYADFERLVHPKVMAFGEPTLV